MAKVILLCGRICSGKTTLARKLRAESKAVLLSVDEVMLAIFGTDAGTRHDEYAARVRKLLYEKSVELVEAGADVILDWGFWRRSDRDWARRFYGERNIPWEFRYLDPDREVRERWIALRNEEVLRGDTDAYYVDEGLLNKMEAQFEEPGPDEPTRSE